MSTINGKNEILSVPLVVVEANEERHERERVRWFILALVLALLLFGTNAYWVYRENQYVDETTTEVTQEIDTDNGAAYVAGIGSVYYGENKTDSTDNNS